jgi:transcriptional regulator with XRE-family HTH domain
MPATAIGTLIRELRVGLGMSQSTLASKLSDVSGQSLTRNDLSRWETGYKGRTPGPFWLRHLATGLQVPLTALESANVNAVAFSVAGVMQVRSP